MSKHEPGCAVELWLAQPRHEIGSMPPCTCATPKGEGGDVEGRFREWFHNNPECCNTRLPFDKCTCSKAPLVEKYNDGWFQGDYQSYLAGHAQGRREQRAEDVGRCESSVIQYEAAAEHEREAGENGLAQDAQCWADACRDLAAEIKNEPKGDKE